MTNITDLDNITDTTLNNCTNNDNNDGSIEIVMPLLLIIPCGLPLICLITKRHIH